MSNLNGDHYCNGVMGGGGVARCTYPCYYLRLSIPQKGDTFYKTKCIRLRWVFETLTQTILKLF